MLKEPAEPENTQRQRGRWRAGERPEERRKTRRKKRRGTEKGFKMIMHKQKCIKGVSLRGWQANLHTTDTTVQH